MLTAKENNNQTTINILTINIHENKDKTKGKMKKSAPIIRPKNINKLLHKDEFFVNSLSDIPVPNYSDDVSMPNNIRIFAFKSKTNTSESSESNLYNNIHNFDLFSPSNSHDETKLLINTKEISNNNIPNLNNNNINKEPSINIKMKEKEIPDQNQINEEDKKEKDSKDIPFNQQQQKLLEQEEKIKLIRQMLKIEEDKYEKMKNDLNSKKNMNQKNENSSSNGKIQIGKNIEYTEDKKETKNDEGNKIIEEKKEKENLDEKGEANIIEEIKKEKENSESNDVKNGRKQEENANNSKDDYNPKGEKGSSKAVFNNNK